ncbi:hypothetical protein IT413_05250 [Candidatus Peregrinibacteria bacterium]|jgi:hypothetical protein|nr:hypothetical protein [Candidatus Peregrinibacteria bacterium]
MSNKHINHKHGLTIAAALRPKSKMWKRANKLKLRPAKDAHLQALADARNAVPSM